MVNYLETDDRQRVNIELGDHGIFDEVAFKRAKLRIVLLITAMVVPMLWMAQKFGEHKRKGEFVTQQKKIAWRLLEKDLNQDLVEANLMQCNRFYLLELGKDILEMQLTNSR